MTSSDQLPLPTRWIKRHKSLHRPFAHSPELGALLSMEEIISSGKAGLGHRTVTDPGRTGSPEASPGGSRPQGGGSEGRRGPGRTHLLMRREAVSTVAGRPQELPQEAVTRLGSRAPGAQRSDPAIQRGPAAATSRSRAGPRTPVRGPRALLQGFPPSPEVRPGNHTLRPPCTDAPHSARHPKPQNLRRLRSDLSKSSPALPSAAPCRRTVS